MLKDRDAIEAQRIERAHTLATEILCRLAGTEPPTQVRDAMKSRGVVWTELPGHVRLSYVQITTDHRHASRRADWATIRAALTGWANAALSARPRWHVEEEGDA